MPGYLPNFTGDLSALAEAEAVLASLGAFEDLDPEESQRNHERLVAPPCRPVLMQLQAPDGAACSDWFYADILDLSLGGLCLLITEACALEPGQALQLDFKDLPSSGLQRLGGIVSWFVRAGNVTTIGVGFTEPLQTLPRLLPERRSRLRDLNAPPDPESVPGS